MVRKWFFFPLISALLLVVPEISYAGWTRTYGGETDDDVTFAQWHTDVRISNTPGVSFVNRIGDCSIGADSSRVHIVWEEGDLFYAYIRYMGFPIGETPSADSGEAVSDYLGKNPVIAVSNNVHVDWFGWPYVAFEKDLYFRERIGSSWGEIIGHGGTGITVPESRFPAIADDQYNNTHCVFNYRVITPTEGYVVVYQSRPAGEEKFGAFVQISTDPPSEGQDTYYPAICVASDNSIHVAWCQQWNNRIGYTRSSNGGSSWSPPIEIPDVACYYEYAPAICFDKDGNFYVAYMDVTSPYQIYVVKRTGNTWGMPTNVSQTPEGLYIFHKTSICADTFGNVWVFWAASGDATRNREEIFYNRLQQGSVTWDGPKQLTPNDYSDSQYPHATADRRGNVHLCWVDTRDGNQEIYYNWFEGGVAIEEQPRVTGELSVSASFVSGKMRVTFALPKGQSGVLGVYNVSGQRVAQTSVSSSGQVEFSQAFPRGVYLVRLESGGSSTTAKVVIQ
ncbi:MAG: T9SS type A sorting domain-containing protein [candidate division WOR-3 bacterium]|nr:T9SS type A sorting domain-containing protein [candidate division WOR-3 bacterium]